MWLWPSLLMYSIAAAELKFVINGTRLVSAPCPFVSDSHATRVQGGAEGSKSRKILLPEILGPRASVGSGNTTGTCNSDSRASGEPMGPSQVDSTRASQVGQNPVKICFLGFLSPETLEYVGVMGMGFIHSDSSFFGFNTTPNGFQNVPDGGSRAQEGQNPVKSWMEIFGREAPNYVEAITKDLYHFVLSVLGSDGLTNELPIYPTRPGHVGRPMAPRGSFEAFEAEKGVHEMFTVGAYFIVCAYLTSVLAGGANVVGLIVFGVFTGAKCVIWASKRFDNWPTVLGLFFFNIALAEAVTCRTCFDQIQGCAGGAACPFVTTAANNGVLLAGAAIAAGAASSLVARDIFPLRFTRILSRGVLDALLVVGRRPPPGTAVDLTTLTLPELSDPVRTAGVDLDQILAEVSTRLGVAGTQIEISRLNAITTSLVARQKLKSNVQGAVLHEDGTSTLVGVYRYCVVLASKVARTRQSDVAVVQSEEASTSTEGVGQKTLPPAKMVRPSSVSELMAVITIWTMMLQGLGISTTLVTGAFLCQVVHEPMADGLVTWQEAFELWMVYLEEVERTAGDEVNLTNVYDRGAQDTMLKRAKDRTPSKRIFRGDDLDDGDEPIKWNGSWDKRASKVCITFNLGKKAHPASCLNSKGGCKFNHICDHWVSDKGTKGTCGGDHPRVSCTNANKCDSPVQ